jgi:hypothetical protein
MPLDDATAFYERSGPSQLALTAAVAPKGDPPKPPIWWSDLYSHLEGRLAAMRNWRLSWWQHWALLAKFILPRRYHWLITANTMTRGLQLNQEIVDSTGTKAMQVCAAGMMSGLTSPNRPWFRLKSGVKNFVADRAALMWFEEVAERIQFVLAESNFYNSLAQMYEDLVTFGTAPVIDYEDEEDIIRCYNPCAGEYFLGVGFDFRHEVLYREFYLTVSQIVEMFKLENCPREIQEIWATKGGSMDTERIVAHAIEPNFPIRGKSDESMRPIPASWEWREVYWLRGVQNDRPLSIRGFHEKPFTASRWSTVSNDPYGRSPGMDALPDIMQLQLETKRKAEGIEKWVRPPMLASATLKNEPASILPGHITFVQTMGPGEGMRPIYEVQPNLAPMLEDLQQCRSRIGVTFFNDLFKMLSDLPAVERRTAEEVAGLREEKLVLLGPVIEGLQNEGLSPRIRRVFSIMQRKQLLPPPPPSLANIPVQIEYVSMLALAQRAAATAGIERTWAFAGNIAAGKGPIEGPKVLRRLDEDATIQYYSELMGVPPKLLRSDQAVAALNDAEAKQQQAQMAMQAGQAAVDGAGTLSKVDVGGGINAVQAMMGNTQTRGSA